MKHIVSILTAAMLIGVSYTAQAQKNSTSLNSREGASATVLLDFDGALVRGTSWNWDGPILAKQPDLLPEKINEIFQRVATDFRIFDVNLTTDSLKFASADPMKRMHIIITPSYEWYGNAGGVALVGSFGWGDDTPCWVFSSLLNNDSKFIAEAISHELGHTMGLLHQSSFDTVCQKTLEYADGTGQGIESWAPIMGVSYYKNVSTWTIGTNEQGCHTMQDDIQVISERVQLLNDDYGDETRSCQSLPLQGGNMQTSGMISAPNDKDIFSFRTNKTTRVIIRVNPEALTNDEGANLNVRLTLMDENNNVIRLVNDSTSLAASVDTTLNSGLYYLMVEGAGNGYMSGYGSRGMYTILGTTVSALPINKVELSGKVSGRNHHLQWAVEADEPIKQVTLSRSLDGTQFTDLHRSSAAHEHYVYQPGNASKYFYRLKVLSEAGSESFSKVIVLQNQLAPKPELMGNVVRTHIQLRLHERSAYELISPAGQRLQRGALTQGINRIPFHFNYQGLLYLRVATNAGYENFTLIRP